jgi:hypothetical protein
MPVTGGGVVEPLPLLPPADPPVTPPPPEFPTAPPAVVDAALPPHPNSRPTKAMAQARHAHILNDMRHSSVLTKPRKRDAAASNATARAWRLCTAHNSRNGGNQDLRPGFRAEL